MDALHIAALLRSVDEPEMAEEVEAMANRLEAFADGLDRDCIATAVAAEREMCAREAERQMEDEPYGHAKFRCANIAAEIRARSNAELRGDGQAQLDRRPA